MPSGWMSWLKSGTYEGAMIHVKHFAVLDGAAGEK